MAAPALRLVTYNVHRCVGTDRALDVERVAGVLASLEPDVVCLQELDVGRARTGGVDQAQAIADHLRMHCRFHPAMAVEEELYGDAILTALPHRLVKAAALPTLPLPGLEPRGALWVDLEIAGVTVQVINTHLGLVPREQRAQAAHLLGPDWLGAALAREAPLMVAGDFNAPVGSSVYRAFRRRLRDAQLLTETFRTVATFPSAFPMLRIDHVFVTPELTVRRVGVADGLSARRASDHLPLIVDFDPPARPRPAAPASAGSAS